MSSRLTTLLLCAAPITAIVIEHLCVDVESEPYFNNDETRHVMTGVFFHDAIADHGWQSPKEYAVRYYLQAPALGLMVWPPFFYGIEGVWMYCFGTSFPAAKALVGLFGIVAGVYFFRLVQRSQGRVVASLALAMLGFSPLIFQFMRQVMLEVPCLALVLAAVFHFERCLDDGRWRDAWLAGILAALAALTRFDGVFLLPYFFVRLLTTGNFHLLKRTSVMGSVLTAVLISGPYYLFTMKEYGSTVSKTAQEGSSANATSFLASKNFGFYPSCVPEQVGWFIAIAAAVGVLCSLRRESRKAMGPAFALLIATYVVFTPMAEMDARHAIYWVPALVMFALAGCAAVARSVHRQRLTLPLSLLVLGGTGIAAVTMPVHHVHGYEDAAQYVVANTRETRVCLMDGFLNGDFIYQLRRHDPERKLWALRGDKLFYTVLCDPHAGYKEHAREEAEVLALIHRYDPELIVVEEPQLYFDLPGARLLRKVLHEHPERFQLEKTIPIRSNHFRFKDARLEIWRNLVRNPERSENLEFEMLTIGRSLGTEMKK